MGIPPPLQSTENKKPSSHEMDTRKVVSKYLDCRESVKREADLLLYIIKLSLDSLNTAKSKVKNKYNQELLDKYMQSFEKFSEMVSKGWYENLNDDVMNSNLLEELKIDEKLNKDSEENSANGPVA